MHLIDERTLASVLDHAGVEDALATALADVATGDAAILARQRVDCGDAKFSSMGGLWRARGVAGVKSYPTVAGQFGFLTTLYDLRSNAACALLPGGELTRWRTAAMALLAARRLCTGAPSKVALFGFGVQGRTIAEALCQQLRPRVLQVVDPAATADAVAAFGNAHCVDARLAPPEAAVRDADLVVTATRAKTPVLQGAWLAPAASVIAVGTSLPTGSELDVETLRRASRVIVEWKPQSLEEAGEIVLGRTAGVLDAQRIEDLPALLARPGAWRQAGDGIIVFKSVGVGLSDVAAAWLAYSRVRQAQAAMPNALASNA